MQGGHSRLILSLTGEKHQTISPFAGLKVHSLSQLANLRGAKGKTEGLLGRIDKERKNGDMGDGKSLAVDKLSLEISCVPRIQTDQTFLCNLMSSKKERGGISLEWTRVLGGNTLLFIFLIEKTGLGFPHNHPITWNSCSLSYFHLTTTSPGKFFQVWLISSPSPLTSPSRTCLQQAGELTLSLLSLCWLLLCPNAASIGQVVLGFQDCDKIHRYGVNDDGIYTILVPKVKKPQRVSSILTWGVWECMNVSVNGETSTCQMEPPETLGFVHK